MTPPMEIDLRIDELVLDGVPVSDAFALRDAVRSALETALRRPEMQNLLVQPCNRDRIDLGEVPLAVACPGDVAGALAASIVAALRSNASHWQGPKPR